MRWCNLRHGTCRGPGDGGTHFVPASGVPLGGGAPLEIDPHVALTLGGLTYCNVNEVVCYRLRLTTAAT